MRFVVDASLPRSAVPLLGELGHEAVDVRDIGMRNATDDVIAAHAQSKRLTLVTRDFDFADIRNTRLLTMPALSCCSCPIMQPLRK